MAFGHLESKRTNTIYGHLSFDADGVPTVEAGDGFTAAETTVDVTDGDFTVTITSDKVPEEVLNITVTPIGALSETMDFCKVLSFSISSNVLTILFQGFDVNTNGAATAQEPGTGTDVMFSVTYKYSPGLTSV